MGKALPEVEISEAQAHIHALAPGRGDGLADDSEPRHFTYPHGYVLVVGDGVAGAFDDEDGARKFARASSSVEGQRCKYFDLLVSICGPGRAHAWVLCGEATQ